MTETRYAIIHEADGDVLALARRAQGGSSSTAATIAPASSRTPPGRPLALWGSQYGHRGVPGDATPEALLACVEDAIARAGEHPGGA